MYIYIYIYVYTYILTSSCNIFIDNTTSQADDAKLLGRPVDPGEAKCSVQAADDGVPGMVQPLLRCKSPNGLR